MDGGQVKGRIRSEVVVFDLVTNPDPSDCIRDVVMTTVPESIKKKAEDSLLLGLIFCSTETGTYSEGMLVVMHYG